MPSGIRMKIQGASLNVSEYPPTIIASVGLESDFEFEIDFLFHYELSIPRFALNLHYVEPGKVKPGASIIDVRLIMNEALLIMMQDVIPKGERVLFQLKTEALIDTLIGPRPTANAHEFTSEPHNIKEAMKSESKNPSVGLLPVPVDQLALAEAMRAGLHKIDQLTTALAKLEERQNSMQQQIEKQLSSEAKLFVEGGISKIKEKITEIHGNAEFLFNTPSADERSLYHKALNMIKNARKRIYICGWISGEFLSELEAKLKEGLEIKVIINDPSATEDKVRKEEFTRLTKLLAPNHIRKLNRQWFHDRFIVIDNREAVVGSMHMVSDSAVRYESGIWVTGTANIQKISHHFDKIWTDVNTKPLAK